MTISRAADLIEQRLAALPPLIEAASQAHASIHATGNTPSSEEIISLSQELSRLARQAQHHDNTQCGPGTVCTFHAQIDGLIQRAQRLLQWDRECAERLLRERGATQHLRVPCTAFSATSYDVYGNIAALEGFVATLKSVAFSALSAATAPDPSLP